MRQLVLLIIYSLSTLALYARSYSPITEAVEREIRAVWLTTLQGLDWPHNLATSKESTERQKAELLTMLDWLQALGINTILFQTRIRATTSYPSAIEPWDGAFTGTVGRGPTYDPLAFAIEACHARGMELHAWVVAFPICKVDAAKKLGTAALPSRHPELCQRSGDGWMMDPGVPATASYLADICREIVTRYAVDGIHLDYIRYPESGIPWNDDKTYRKYGNGKNRKTWRTENVNRCVHAIHDAVKSVRPWIKLSCSPVGKYSDLPRQSAYGWNARDAVNQDAQLWLKKGWMDYLFPMMYFDGKHYYPFLADWQENAADGLIAPGLGIYLLHEKEKNWPLEVIRRQINVAQYEGTGGIAFFRAKFLLDNVKGLYDWLREVRFRRPALVPPMIRSDNTIPAAPSVKKEITGNHLVLSWQPVLHDTPVTYNVYRLDSVRGDRLMATRLRENRYETTIFLPALKHSRYVVTASDAYGNESNAE